MEAPTVHVNPPDKAIGYIRVSTHEQAQEGVSLDAQRERLREYCKSTGIRLVDIVADEGWSASTLERPGLHEALIRSWSQNLIGSRARSAICASW
jgi:predicted site-specific integrase-resolvase